MAKNRDELKMALRILITVMSAILEMLENSTEDPKEARLAGKDGEKC